MGVDTRGEIEFSIDCTDSAIADDVIEFRENAYKKTDGGDELIGERTVRGRILKDTYGDRKHYDSMRIEVLESTGADIIAPGEIIARKYRNIYRKGVLRRPWDDEYDRAEALKEKRLRDEKHK